MDRKNIIVVSGGPGFGKTSIIRELEKSGYLISDEYARDLIRQQVSIGGNILPWEDMKRFQQEVMDLRIQFYLSVPGEETAFADRGLPDQLAFARFRGLKPPKILLENIQQYPYFPVVFIAPPWKAIYSKDTVRDESFEEAERLHQFICTTYRELGYDPVEIPRTDVPERARFITRYLEKVMSHL